MNMFKRKKDKYPTASAPRSIDEINKDYADLIGKAGQTQYLVSVYSNELKDINAKLLKVNQEAAARNALENADKKEEPKNEQV